MKISPSKVGWLLVVWAFFIGLVGVGMTVPTLLIIVGSILYLLY